MIEFVHPAFLWALPAVSLPVLIHLLNRLRYRRVAWAAMDHLMRAERQSRRRIRWQNLLVLLLRTAAVLLLILLFARPSVVRPLPGLSGADTAAAERAAVVILLDDSASMAQQEGGTSAFQKAKDFTLAAVKKLADPSGRGAGGRGASVTAYVASEEEPFFRKPDGRPADVGDIEEALQRLRPGASAFDPAERLPRLGARAPKQTEDLHFYVVTDLRATDWGKENLDAGARRGLEALQEYGTVCLINVGSVPGPNAGIADVLGTDGLTYARCASVLRAVVANDGAQAWTPPRVEVRLDGGALPPAAAPAIPGGERREVPLEVYLDAPGRHAVEVSLPGGDAFPPDDRRFAAFEAVESVPVLVVEGDAGTAPAEGSAYYLRTALQPGTAPRAGIRPEVHYAGSAAPADLRNYAAVFLCNVASPALWQDALKRYAEAGGRVVLFLGERVDAAAWNDSLLAEQDGLLPCRLEERVRADPAEPVHLARLDYGHPLLSPFADWGSLFAIPRFTAYYRIGTPGDAAVLARFDDQGSSPAMLARPVGDGSVVLFASSADDDWTDWPRSEAGRIAYVALMQWLAESAAAAGRPRLNLVGGSPLEYPLDPSRFRPEATLRRADEFRREAHPFSVEQILHAREHEREDGLWFISDGLTRAGIWELRLTGHDGGETSLWFAVNIPDRERLLAQTEPELLLGAAASPGRLEVLTYDDEALESALAGSAAPGRYWPILAAALILVLVVESVLAHVFGNPADRRTAR